MSFHSLFFYPPIILDADPFTHALFHLSGIKAFFFIMALCGSVEESLQKPVLETSLKVLLCPSRPT